MISLFRISFNHNILMIQALIELRAQLEQAIKTISEQANEVREFDSARLFLSYPIYVIRREAYIVLVVDTN